MTTLKMWCLLPLSVLLFVSISPAVTEVVELMSKCEGYFLNKPPEVPGILENCQISVKKYKIICQTYRNISRFVTLYDTENRIPVFSAYKYRGEERKNKKFLRPKNFWNIEPQLEDMTETENNMVEWAYNKIYNNQASNSDYWKSENYNRGHLFPFSHGFDGDDKNSTFTLTNIVPQAFTFNGGSWRKMEESVKSLMNTKCLNNNDKIEGYVVTGAQPGEDKLNNRVNIPSMLWSAFCCYSDKNREWISGAFWGDNIADGSKTTILQMKTLAELSDKLSSGSTLFEAFPETKCSHQKTKTTTQGSSTHRDPVSDKGCIVLIIFNICGGVGYVCCRFKKGKGMQSMAKLCFKHQRRGRLYAVSATITVVVLIKYYMQRKKMQ